MLAPRAGTRTRETESRIGPGAGGRVAGRSRCEDITIGFRRFRDYDWRARTVTVPGVVQLPFDADARVSVRRLLDTGSDGCEPARAVRAPRQWRGMGTMEG